MWSLYLPAWQARPWDRRLPAGATASATDAPGKKPGKTAGEDASGPRGSFGERLVSERAMLGSRVVCHLIQHERGQIAQLRKIAQQTEL
jgi:hypothetical protein